jgi:nicotinamidase-related amidase
MSFQGYNISAAREIIPRVQNLLTTFRAYGFPIYHTREGHRPDLSTLSSRELTRSKNNESGKGIGDYGPLGRLLIRGQPGHDIIPELYPLPGENVIDKPGRSAFQHTEFGLMLKIKGIKNLIICGVTTDVCVHSTMREANDNGFDCLLVEDATAASEPHLHAGAVESVKAEGGIFGAVSTADRILAALEVKKEDMANEPVSNDADIKSFDALRLSDGTSRGMPSPQQMFPPGQYGFPPGFIPPGAIPPQNVTGRPPRNTTSGFLEGLGNHARSAPIPPDGIRAPQPRRSIPQDVLITELKIPGNRKLRDDGPSSK